MGEARRSNHAHSQRACRLQGSRVWLAAGMLLSYAVLSVAFHLSPTRVTVSALVAHPKNSFPPSRRSLVPSMVCAARSRTNVGMVRSRSALFYPRHCRGAVKMHSSALSSLGITEFEIITRLLMATFAGASIGFERRYSERPAGLRTMALVSLGAAIFTIISLGIPGDKSRMAASVASGVGFIGAGVISQNGFEDSSRSGGRRIQQVNGLTTATAIWVSAALGVSSGAGLNLLTFIGAALAVCVLRVGRFTRMIRLRRRDLASLAERAFSLKPAAPAAKTPIPTGASSVPASNPSTRQETLMVAGGAGGSLLSSPPPDSPFLVGTWRPNSSTPSASSSFRGKAPSRGASPAKRGGGSSKASLKTNGCEEGDEAPGIHEYAAGVPGPSDLCESTSGAGMDSPVGVGNGVATAGEGEEGPVGPGSGSGD